MLKTVPGAVPAGILILSVIFADGCAVPPANLTASFGGSTAGSRGSVRVLFINNTPQRAVFTYGTYDQTDQFSQPDFRQFGLNSTDLNLDGDSESSIDPISGQSPLICARVFGVGSPDLLRLIDEYLSGATVKNVTEMPAPLVEVFGDAETAPSLRMVIVPVDLVEGAETPDRFMATALRRFQQDHELADVTSKVEVRGRLVYRYTRPLRESVMRARAFGVQPPSFAATADVDDPIADPVAALLVIDRTSTIAQGQLLRNRIYIIAVWLAAGLGAVVVFYLILTKLILSPVRHLR
ncbi:MAG: hypothetical protein IIC51_10220, partial [Planctomycetes bacterium]|nr:hypothetical protein [Planctomycetota bacterium]